MVGYTKLFASILDSTIWREPDHVRLVWITLLAMCDRNGEVEASVPGLADRSRVSIDDCMSALERLSSPDKWSRSTAHEGRRIEAIEGGWRLLNHRKYREKMSDDERRARDAERKRAARARAACAQDASAECPQASENVRDVSHTKAEAEAREGIRTVEEKNSLSHIPALDHCNRVRVPERAFVSTAPDAWTPDRQAVEFRKAWLERYQVEPSMGGKAVGGFHAIVTGTAEARGEKPRDLFIATLGRWLDGPRGALDARAPYASFCAAWGGLLGPATQDGPKTLQQRWDDAQAELREANAARDVPRGTKARKLCKELEAQMEREERRRR